jgi:hypothetical protein
VTVVLKNGRPAAARLMWRVNVGTAGLDPTRPSRPLSWHLATCVGALDAESHCAEGNRLIATLADPDGHCLLDGQCPRCLQLAD